MAVLLINHIVANGKHRTFSAGCYYPLSIISCYAYYFVKTLG